MVTSTLDKSYFKTLLDEKNTINYILKLFITEHQVTITIAFIFSILVSCTNILGVKSIKSIKKVIKPGRKIAKKWLKDPKA